MHHRDRPNRNELGPQESVHDDAPTARTRAVANASIADSPVALRATEVQLKALDTALVQFRASALRRAGHDVHAVAAGGMRGGAMPLPHAEAIQRSFGRHDVSAIKAHAGPAADQATQRLGARAYASGDNVVLGAGGTDLHTVAHEAAHVIQQRGGVSLKSGVGQSGDVYERHADQVADAVVQGKSAEGLLDRFAPSHAQSAASVQRAAVQFDEYDSDEERQQDQERVNNLTREDLDYNIEMVRPHEGRDPNRGRGRLPYQGDGWQHEQILNHLSQMDGQEETDNDNVRCYSYSFMAGPVANGPAAVANLVINTRAYCQVAARSEEGDVAARLQEDVRNLAGMDQRILNQRGTYRDLALLSAAIHHYTQRDRVDHGANPEEGERANPLLTNTGNEGEILDGQRNHGPGHLRTIMGRLRPGYAYILGVNMERTPEGDGVNHAVRIGHDGQSAFLYDPMCRTGAQMLRWPAQEADVLDYGRGHWLVRTRITPEEATR